MRQQVFVNHYVSGMNGTEAALIAYGTNDRNTAAVIASQNLRKLKIQEAINKLACDYHELGANIAHALDAGLKAMKYNRSTKTMEPDLRTQLRTADKILKFWGLYPTKS
jgi:phage terminase small subunit